MLVSNSDSEQLTIARGLIVASGLFPASIPSKYIFISSVNNSRF